MSFCTELAKSVVNPSFFLSLVQKFYFTLTLYLACQWWRQKKVATWTLINILKRKLVEKSPNHCGKIPNSIGKKAHLNVNQNLSKLRILLKKLTNLSLGGLRLDFRPKLPIYATSESILFLAKQRIPLKIAKKSATREPNVRFQDFLNITPCNKSIKY